MQVSIDTVNADIGDSLVACYRFIVKCRDIDDITISLYQIDIGILIDGYKSFSLLAPSNMSDMGVTKSIYLIVG